jgi:hypothetical protein
MSVRSWAITITGDSPGFAWYARVSAFDVVASFAGLLALTTPDASVRARRVVFRSGGRLARPLSADQGRAFGSRPKSRKPRPHVVEYFV